MSTERHSEALTSPEHALTAQAWWGVGDCARGGAGALALVDAVEALLAQATATPGSAPLPETSRQAVVLAAVVLGGGGGLREWNLVCERAPARPGFALARAVAALVSAPSALDTPAGAWVRLGLEVGVDAPQVLWGAQDALSPGEGWARSALLAEACGSAVEARLGSAGAPASPRSLGEALLGQECARLVGEDLSLRRRCLRRVVGGEVGGGDPTGALAATAARLLRERALRPRGRLCWVAGLPGVGKSTWARAEAERSGAVLLGAEGRRRRDRAGARTQMWEESARLLGQGVDVVVDATHLSRTSRDVLLAAAERGHAQVRGVWHTGSLELALARQRSRPWRDAVPGEVVAEMAARRAWPSADEADELTLVHADGSSETLTETVWSHPG